MVPEERAGPALADDPAPAGKILKENHLESLTGMIKKDHRASGRLAPKEAVLRDPALVNPQHPASLLRDQTKALRRVREHHHQVVMVSGVTFPIKNLRLQTEERDHMDRDLPTRK